MLVIIQGMRILPQTFVGRLVADPELRFTPSGAAVTNFRIAYNPNPKKNPDGTWDNGEGTFLTVNVWRGMAENVASSLQKGMEVIVIGKLAQRTYQTKEGEGRTVYEVQADNVGPALEWQTAVVQKSQARGEGQQTQGSGWGHQPATGGFGQAQTNVQQGLGGQPASDPWNSAPPAGEQQQAFGGQDDDPPF